MIDKLFKKIEDIEYQLQMQKAQIIELQAELLSQRRCEDPPDTLKAMEYELRYWQDQRNLPHTSADEIDQSKLDVYDQNWVIAFIERWDYHSK